jgi:hypothetical protein
LQNIVREQACLRDKLSLHWEFSAGKTATNISTI